MKNLDKQDQKSKPDVFDPSLAGRCWEHFSKLPCDCNSGTFSPSMVSAVRFLCLVEAFGLRCPVEKKTFLLLQGTVFVDSFRFHDVLYNIL